MEQRSPRLQLKSLSRDTVLGSWLDGYLPVVAEAAEQKHYIDKLRCNKAHSRGSSCLHYSIKKNSRRLQFELQVGSMHRRPRHRSSSCSQPVFVVSPIAFAGGQEGLDKSIPGLSPRISVKHHSCNETWEYHYCSHLVLYDFMVAIGVYVQKGVEETHVSEKKTPLFQMATL